MIQFGIDSLEADGFKALAGRRVGLMTNPAAVNSALVTTYDVFRKSDARLAALFAPEHGFAGAVADGERVALSVDRRTGLPVFSLYGESYRPTPAMLESVDVVVCDIQDVGVRYYTFLWTISYILEACGESGVEVMVLDRPNPLGDTVRGGGLAPEFSSFVGRFPVPVQHGMTLGELAQMMNAVWNPTPAKLTVIPCKGWRPESLWPETGLAYTPPSPNMPHFVTNLHYPGACLIEGTTLSEGRGTALPFEITGAPYIDGIALAEQLNRYAWPGVRFRPHTFQPAASKYAGQYCDGVQAHITDSRAYDPLGVWLGVIHEIRHRYPESFTWWPSYHEAERHHFDRLIGSASVRPMIDKGAPLDALMAVWDAFCQEFRTARRPYLLYERG